MANQQFNNILKEEKLQEIRVGLKVIIFVLAILVCLQQIEIFNVARMAKGISAMGTFFTVLVPPDFSDTRSWIIPVCETLAMSV